MSQRSEQPSDPVQTEYTPEERVRMLRAMQDAAGLYYAMARSIGYHQFLELTGLMNEMIKICEGMHARGIDFPTNELELEPHHAAYLGEKIGCIFGAALADGKTRDAFMLGVLKG